MAAKINSALLSAAVQANETFVLSATVQRDATITADSDHALLCKAVRQAIVKGNVKADALAKTFKAHGATMPNAPKGTVYGSEGSVSTLQRVGRVLALPVGADDVAAPSRKIMGTVRTALLALKVPGVDAILGEIERAKGTQKMAVEVLAAETKIVADLAKDKGDDESVPVTLGSLLAAASEIVCGADYVISASDVAAFADLLAQMDAISQSALATVATV